jgi:polyketide cyclase/dehydrase/lipid transport protein
MNVSVDIDIIKSREQVWSTITDIKNCSNFISGINALEILHQPEQGLVGLKWKETRMMFGKEASETMWITEAVTYEYYCTRAESHGSVYLTRLSLSEIEGKTNLTMSFSGEAQTFFVKLISIFMGPFVKGSMKKMLYKDLEDIKAYLEKV